MELFSAAVPGRPPALGPQGEQWAIEPDPGLCPVRPAGGQVTVCVLGTGAALGGGRPGGQKLPAPHADQPTGRKRFY